ncbi:MAG: hypothetical protein GX657_02470 [Chloroflexi bacterium]|nr:hypothetical protein [Chloroflexota bacterium]
MAKDTVFNQTQVGVEAAAAKGTPVAAGIILPATGIAPGVNPEIMNWRRPGGKYTDLTAVRREWTQGTLSGVPSYADLFYLLCAHVGAPETTGAAAPFTHKWLYAAHGPDATIRSLTVQHGDPSAYVVGDKKAFQFAYGIVQELGMEWRRAADPTLSGRMIGYPLEYLTQQMSSGTLLVAAPILPGDISVYLDDAEADLGDTQLTEVSRLRFSSGNKVEPRWALNASTPGYTREVELAPNLTIDLTMAADEAFAAELARYRVPGGGRAYLKVTAVSALEAATGTPFSLTIQMAGRITRVEPFADDEGVYAVGITYSATPGLTRDAAADHNVASIELVNAITALA